MKTLNTVSMIGIALLLCVASPSCTSIPKNAQAVSGFDLQKYLGK